MTLQKVFQTLKGGDGSGNFGHAGGKGGKGNPGGSSGGGGGGKGGETVSSSQPSWLTYADNPSTIKKQLEELKTGKSKTLYFRGDVVDEVSSRFINEYEERDLTGAGIPKSEGREFQKGNRFVGVYYEEDKDYTGVSISNFKPKPKPRIKPTITRAQYD